jgi:hypothetical protein
MIGRSCLVLLVALGAVASPQAAVQAAAVPPRVIVGPNMLVSRDGDFPHIELIVAANPKNVKNLVGGAITYTRPNGGTACRAYATLDGGATWHASEFAEQIEWGGGDPYVAFTPQGTALFCALTMAKDENSRQRAFMHVWRSEDGGRSWPAKPADLGCSYDFEKMVVDQTTGTFAGRAYIAALYGYPVYRVGLFRSADDGRSWTGPVEVTNGGGTIGVGAVAVLILSDGTLVIPVVRYEFLPEKVKKTGKITRPMSLMLSSDGGISFTPPHEAPAAVQNMDDPSARDTGGIEAFAADAGSKDYRDRIYMAWADSRRGRLRILFSRSEDRGLHWSEPIPVDGSVPKETIQFQTVVAVNKEGVVGVTWYDTRGSRDGSQFDEYFAASVDGGRSFLPSVRVSTASSGFRGPGNMRMDPFVFDYKDEIHLSLISAVSRWPSGGDYLGLAADKDGVFHPLWADARSGAFQAYTADVSVELPAGEKPVKREGAAAPPEPPKPAPRTSRSLRGMVEFVFDPTRYDGAARESEIPVRLRNVSNATIYAPITLEITGFGMNDPELPKDDNPAPIVVNAANGKTGVGAVFDFSNALGNQAVLEPGALTSPVVMRLKFEDPAKIPPIRLKVEGSVEEGK